LLFFFSSWNNFELLTTPPLPTQYNIESLTATSQDVESGNDNQQSARNPIIPVLPIQQHAEQQEQMQLSEVPSRSAPSGQLEIASHNLNNDDAMENVLHEDIQQTPQIHTNLTRSSPSNQQTVEATTKIYRSKRRCDSVAEGASTGKRRKISIPKANESRRSQASYRKTRSMTDYEDKDAADNELIAKEQIQVDSVLSSDPISPEQLHEHWTAQCRDYGFPPPLSLTEFDTTDWRHVSKYDNSQLKEGYLFKTTDELAVIPRRHPKFQFCHPGPQQDEATRDWYYADSVVQEVKLRSTQTTYYVVRWVGYEDE